MSAERRPLVVLEAEELKVLVSDAVAEALESRPSAEIRRALLDRRELATALGCSESHVDKQRAKGMPTVWLGQVPRFELDRCLAWLREQSP